MKNIIGIFEIPDDQSMAKDIIPKLSTCRVTSSGADVFGSLPALKIIDDPLLVNNIMNVINGFPSNINGCDHDSDFMPKDIDNITKD